MLNVNNIDNEKISLKDLVADKLNAAPAAAAQSDEKPQTENILVTDTVTDAATDEKTKPEETAEEANNSNLRNTIKSLNQKAKDSVDADMSKFQLGKDENTETPEEKEKEKEEKKRQKEGKKRGFTQDTHGRWNFDATKVLPKSGIIYSSTALVDRTIEAFEFAEKIGDYELLKDVARTLRPYTMYANNVNTPLGDIEIRNRIRDHNRAYYDALYSEKKLDEIIDEMKKRDLENKEDNNGGSKPADPENGEKTDEQIAAEEAKKKAEEEKRKQEEAAAAAEAKRKAEEAKKKQEEKEETAAKDKDSYNTLDKTNTIILQGNETAEEIRNKARQQTTIDVDLTNSKLEKKEDAAKLKDFLPHFAISRYLNNEFGDVSKNPDGTPKNPESKKQADRTLAYFILDKIGTGLVNSSLMMNGLSPTQKSALQKYNETQMDNALKRDDNVRSKIITDQLNNIVKEFDTQLGFNIGQVKLGDDVLSLALKNNIDNVNKTQALKLLKAQAEYLNTLSQKDRETMVQAILLQSTGDSAMKILGEQWELEMLRNKKGAEAEIKEKEYDIENYGLMKMYAASTQGIKLKMLEQEYKNMVENGRLTAEQANNVMMQVQLHQKDLDWYDKTALMKQISGYTKIGTDILSSAGSFINSLKPGR